MQWWLELKQVLLFGLVFSPFCSLKAVSQIVKYFIQWNILYSKNVSDLNSILESCAFEEELLRSIEVHLPQWQKVKIHFQLKNWSCHLKLCFPYILLAAADLFLLSTSRYRRGVFWPHSISFQMRPREEVSQCVFAIVIGNSCHAVVWYRARLI